MAALVLAEAVGLVVQLGLLIGAGGRAGSLLATRTSLTGASS